MKTYIVSFRANKKKGKKLKQYRRTIKANSIMDAFKKAKKFRKEFHTYETSTQVISSRY